MPNSLFSTNTNSSTIQNHMNSLLGGMDPQQAFNNMMQSNPQFAQFVEANRGKTPEQVAREHGIDLSAMGRMMGR